MENEESITASEPVGGRKIGARGCVFWFVGLIVFLLIWDLYPLWSLRIKQGELRQIAETGKSWAVVESQLKENGFKPMPIIVDVSFGSGDMFIALPPKGTSNTARLVQIEHKRPFIESVAISAASKTLPEKWLNRYRNWKFQAEIATVLLDADGKVRQVD